MYSIETTFVSHDVERKSPKSTTHCFCSFLFLKNKIKIILYVFVKREECDGQACKGI